MKSMLMRLWQNQLKQLHRLINPVLFAYREVPQDIAVVKTSYEYLTELREHLEDSLKVAQEE